MEAWLRAGKRERVYANAFVIYQGLQKRVRPSGRPPCASSYRLEIPGEKIVVRFPYSFDTLKCSSQFKYFWGGVAGLAYVALTRKGARSAV